MLPYRLSFWCSVLVWRGRRLFVPALALFLLGYFSFHMVMGRHGLVSYWHLQAEVAMAEDVAARLTARRIALEDQTKRMRPDSLDTDLLEELSRSVLGLGTDGDIIVLNR